MSVPMRLNVIYELFVFESCQISKPPRMIAETTKPPPSNAPNDPTETMIPTIHKTIHCPLFGYHMSRHLPHRLRRTCLSLSSDQSSISDAIRSGDAFVRTALLSAVSILKRMSRVRVSSNTTTHPGNSSATHRSIRALMASFRYQIVPRRVWISPSGHSRQRA